MRNLWGPSDLMSYIIDITVTWRLLYKFFAKAIKIGSNLIYLFFEGSFLKFNPTVMFR